MGTAARVGASLNTPGGIAELSKLGRSLILDMDDTVISNRIHFDEAMEALVEIYRRLGGGRLQTDEIRALHARTSAELFPSLGPTPERWFTTGQRTAAEAAGRSLTPVEAAEVRRAAEIAMHDGELLPGVEDALTACRAANLSMVLKTRGEEAKQNQKVREHGLRRFFGKSIWIVGSKDARSFRTAVERYALVRPVSIGDSVASDIVPAREAGLDAIFLESQHQVPDHEVGADHSLPSGALSAPSLPEALRLLLDQRARDAERLR